MNDNTPIYLRSLSLKDYKCFIGENVFNFCSGGKNNDLSQCTIILGDNGTGKTNLLKAIANLEPVPESIKNVVVADEVADDVKNFFADMLLSQGGMQLTPTYEDVPKYIPVVIERHKAQKQYDVECDFVQVVSGGKNIKKSKYEKVIRCKTPFIQPNGTTAIAENATKYGYSNNFNFSEPCSQLANLRIDAYGTNRHSVLGSKRLHNQFNSESLFIQDNRLIDVESWLLQLDTAKQHQRPGASKKYEKVRNLIRHSFLFPGVKDISIDFNDSDNSSFVCFTTDRGKFKLEELGYGYQCMFSWIFDFCKKMIDRYPNSNKPFHEPAILLVDEIDMHLHPQWQRTIVSELCKMFPNTQLILTTHSPLVIQSIEQVNLFVLKDDGKCIKVNRYPNFSFQGWTVEEILGELMGLNEATRSDRYNTIVLELNNALLNRKEDKAYQLFVELKKILHPNNIDKEIFEMQIESMHDHD